MSAAEETNAEPVRPATAIPEVTSKPTVDWLSVSGKTEEGLAYLGNPDAPVTLIDYSDFL